MKLLINESFFSKHFFNRLNERIPKTVLQNYQEKSKVFKVIEDIKNFTFPDGKFLILAHRFRRLDLFIIVENNQLVTAIVADKFNCDDCIRINNFESFKNNLNVRN